MNWVLILVLLLLGYNMMRGYQKGFLRIIYAMVAWLVVILLTAWVMPYVKGALLAGKVPGEQVRVIAFFIALLGSCIVVHLVSQLLGIVSKIPVLKGINRFFGVLLGGIYGIIQVWVIFGIIALSGTGALGGLLITYIHQSDFLRALYENNAILFGVQQYL